MRVGELGLAGLILCLLEDRLRHLAGVLHALTNCGAFLLGRNLIRKTRIRPTRQSCGFNGSFVVLDSHQSADCHCPYARLPEVIRPPSAFIVPPLWASCERTISPC